MQHPGALRRSIVLAVLGHFFAQIAYFGVAAALSNIVIRHVLGYLVTSATVHIALGAFLLFRAADFVTVPGGRRLERINVANVLTMFRISAVPTILFFIFLSDRYDAVGWLIALTSVAFITDFVDGKISRSRGEITRIGQYLDSSSDYTILAAVSIAFTHFGLVSTWFFWLLIIRLTVQVVGMAALFVYQGGYVEPRSSFLGKASVFAAMVVFAVSLLTLIPGVQAFGVAATLVGEIIASAIIAVSIGDKLILLYRDFNYAASSKPSRRDRSDAEGR
jgi:phosphatidylglycerophosphate synthase